MADIDTPTNGRVPSVSFLISNEQQSDASSTPSSQQPRTRHAHPRTVSSQSGTSLSNAISADSISEMAREGADDTITDPARDPFLDVSTYAGEMSDKTASVERISTNMIIRGLETISKLQYTLRGIHDRSGRSRDSIDISTKSVLIKLEKQLVDITCACQDLGVLFHDLDATRADVLGRLAAPSVIEAIANARHTPKVILPNQGDVNARSSMAGQSPNMFGRPMSLAHQNSSGSGGSVDMMSFLANAQSGPGAPGSANSPAPSQPKMFSKLPKEILDANLPKPELMRLSAVYELIETEADYCRDLSTMINFHKVQMRETKIISEQEITALFSNVEQLLSANQNLLSRLQARRDQNPIVQEVGDVIAESAESLKVYTTYAANYPSAMKLVHQLQARADLKAILQQWMNSSEARGLSLESFLIKPVQRICKYPLLLRELEKYTEKAGNTADQVGLRTAAEKIEGVVSLVNEATRHAEERQRILNLETNIESPVPLGFADKKHLRDGPLQRLANGKSKDRYVILFTDVMFICKSNKATGKYELEAGFSLAELILRNDGRDTMRARTGNVIQLNVISSEEKEIITFITSSEEDRNKWLDSFYLAFRDITEEHRSAFKNNYGTLRQSGIMDGSSSMSRGTIKRVKNTTRNTTLGAASGILRKQVATRKSMMETWMMSGTSSNANANSLQEPELVDVGGVIHKRAISATGHIYYFAVTTKQSVWRLPEGFTVIESTPQPGPINADGETQETAASDPTRVSMDIEEDENIILDFVEGFPDWRRVDRGDGVVYFFNVATQETSWEAPGGSSDASPEATADAVPVIQSDA